MSAERAKVAVQDHVAEVMLTRPEKHNALDVAMFEAILAAAGKIRRTPGVRVVVLHGEGPSFCSGLDIPGIAGGPGGMEAFVARVAEGSAASGPNFAQRAAHDWIDLPVPVIAALHGACFGGGLQIALGADIRIAAPDARLSVMEVRWGLVPDMSITQTLPRLVGIDVAKELTYTGRTVDGTEAARLGLVTRIAQDPLTAARELAQEIAVRSPDAVRAAKRLYDSAWVAPAPEALALEAELQLGLIGSPNQIAAVTAGFSGQPGEFADPAPDLSDIPRLTQEPA
jgi:enoyl-CoA hydratase/carnithine racemase